MKKCKACDGEGSVGDRLVDGVAKAIDCYICRGTGEVGDDHLTKVISSPVFDLKK